MSMERKMDIFTKEYRSVIIRQEKGVEIMIKKIKKYTKQWDMWLIIFSVLFSGMLVISRHVYYDWKTTMSVHDIYVSDFHIVDMFVLMMYIPFIYLGMKIISYIFCSTKQKLFGLQRKRNLILFWGCFFFIMVLWIPYFMTYWPGGIYSDTVDTLDMALKNKALDNHNPLLYTFIWRFIFWITGAFRGEGVYGGLKLFTVLQSALMAFMLSGFIHWTYKKGIHKGIIIMEVIIAACYPLYPFYGISLWKDTIFSIAVFAFSVFLYEIFDKEEDRISNKNLIIYIVMTILIIFLRNNGIYIACFYSLGMFFLCLKDHKKMGKKLGFSSLVIIMLAFVIQNPVYDKFGLNSDTSTESLGVPMQQVAYIYTTDGKVNAEELEVLNNILPLENWSALYNPIVADYIKFDPSFNKEYMEENATEFLKVYVSLVVKNPVKAIKGYLLETMGFWDITKNSPTAYICNTHFGNAEYFMSDYFDYYFGFSFKEYVEPRNFISSAIFVWIMIGAIFLCLSQGNRKGVICILPTLGLWLSIMIAVPVAFSFRYVYAIFLCVPLYVLVSIRSFEKKQK